MYITKFCDDPDNIIVLDTAVKSFEDSIFKEYGEKLRILDRYMFLVDTYAIIMDCSSDLKAIMPQSEDAFWKVNKYLLNYVNAVYCYHEFVNNYDPPLKIITENTIKKRAVSSGIGLCAIIEIESFINQLFSETIILAMGIFLLTSMS